MDIPKKQFRSRRRAWRVAAGLLVVLLISIITVGISRLEPAAPTVEKESIVTGTVAFGAMLREVSASGSLVPREVNWIVAITDGRVKSIPAQVGTQVTTDTVLLELSNPDLDLDLSNAEWQIRSAEADLATQRAALRDEFLTLKGTISDLVSSEKVTEFKVKAQDHLFRSGLLSSLEMTVSRSELERLRDRLRLETERLKQYQIAEKDRLAALQAKVEQARASYQMKNKQVAALKVRAGVCGILEQISEGVGVGRLLTAGAVLAKVSDPATLKAVLKIPESEARDIALGLPVRLEVADAVYKGTVCRVDPSVVEGSVSLDVLPVGGFAAGVRPDLSVTGSIQVERLSNVLYVDRPANVQSNSSCQMFVLDREGRIAFPRSVRFGKVSSMFAQVLDGLHKGEVIILSDMERWHDKARIAIR